MKLGVVRVTSLVLCMGLASVVGAAGALAVLTASESTDALKQALGQAASVAVARLGKVDGFMADPAVRIPLPGKLQKASKTLRRLGLNKQTDALVLAMNRAAEAAVPEAGTLFRESIQQMSISDALGILKGPEDAATRYFRNVMNDKLTAKFLPIVSKATADVQLAQRYNDVAGKASALGLVDPRDAKLDDYVTRMALDGLFLMMAREEAAIRKDPLGQANALLRKVFGAIGK
jgi:Protein of unknown function (DUF4197)